jgi:rubrerythrin
MYPQMIEDAKAEGNKAALQELRLRQQSRAIHADLYQKAIDTIKTKKDLPAADIYVCPVCGNTFEGKHQTSAQSAGRPKRNVHEDSVRRFKP